jgi:O-antigen/teichoic acid export membrane protein
MKAATFVATFADRYFLQAAGNEAMVGLYNLAYQFGFLMIFLGFSPIELVWGPKRLQVAMSANPDPVLSRGFRFVNLILITTAVGLILFVGDVLHVMATPPFYAAANVVPIIVAAYVLQGWASVQDIGILVSERTRILMVVNWIAALVALGGYALLIPRYYGFGAAIATFVAFAVRYVLTYVASQRVWKVEYEWRPVIRLVVVAAVVCGVAVLLPSLGLATSLGIHLLLLATYLGLVWIGGVMTAAEKTAVLAHSRGMLSEANSRVRAWGWLASRRA